MSDDRIEDLGGAAAVPHTKADPAERLSAERRMLEALVCPVTQQGLEWDREAGELISRHARLAFPVREGIPIMLVSEARPLED